MTSHIVESLASILRLQQLVASARSELSIARLGQDLFSADWPVAQPYYPLDDLLYSNRLANLLLPTNIAGSLLVVRDQPGRLCDVLSATKRFTKVDWVNPSSLSDLSDRYDHALVIECLENAEHLADELSKTVHTGGIIAIRIKPWTARHGGRGLLNKAFAHLLLSEIEIAELGLEWQPPLQKPIRPILWAEQQLSPWKTINRSVQQTPVEPFFRQFEQALRGVLAVSSESELFRIMSVDYLDYLVSNG